MTFFDALTLIGGLSLFLFGMHLLGDALEMRAGNQLKNMLGRLTASPIKGFLLGLVVTTVVQSSSATTVMVVGFVNSGLMTLSQTVGIIVGANLGAATTPLILSLSGISGGNFFLNLLKPTSFTPILALIGVIILLFVKNPKKQNTGLLLLAFSVLMFGMTTMSDAVSGLAGNESFTRVLTVFSNPVLGLLAGLVVTVAIQSSGASIGILQALAATGGLSVGTVIPILMGQNIGTCISALLASVGANKNAKRAALIHLLFNVIGALICLLPYVIVTGLVEIPFLATNAGAFTIAWVNLLFKVVAVVVFLPFAKHMTGFVTKLIREDKQVAVEKTEEVVLLDERLFNSPALAVARSGEVAHTMLAVSFESMKMSLRVLEEYDERTIDEIDRMEGEVDMYEDKLGSYLVRLSSHNLTEQDSREVTKLLRLIGDVERISDHAVNLTESAREMKEKDISFSDEARSELDVMVRAIYEILDLAAKAFLLGDLAAASMVEPLEQVVDNLRDELKKRHIIRLQNSRCTIEHGFVLSDILTNLERVADHCSNIAGCEIEMTHASLDMHEYLHGVRDNAPDYKDHYAMYAEKYMLKEAGV